MIALAFAEEEDHIVIERSCHKDLNFLARKEGEEPLWLQIRNDGGNIRFAVTDLT